ncbi:hypothetical protein [Bacteroides thetaiotaomicron]|uniref:hypothetical protein n=1 Tax=Bacteroides thetaiotaomicron TaxID=818 RepID=UPI00356A435C
MEVKMLIILISEFGWQFVGNANGARIFMKDGVSDRIVVKGEDNEFIDSRNLCGILDMLESSRF